MHQAVRGMRDVLPADTWRWSHLERKLFQRLTGASYSEIRLPLMEFTELFARGVGEATDIVEKEMYTLSDRDGMSISLRPEGTASCVRALEEHGLLYNKTCRTFYSGPMFRYEKPQKGRYRQFYQMGVEAFGFEGPDIEAELVLLITKYFEEIGLNQYLTLEINTLGSHEDRGRYREALVSYLTPFYGELDEDSQRRLKTNPLRILDSKIEKVRDIVVDAPKLIEFVGKHAREHFDRFQELLGNMNLAYKVNDRLVRGLDYYTNTVFEWVTEELGSQGAVCAGGRYDGLVEQLGGKSTPAVGLAMGLDRIVLLHEKFQADNGRPSLDIYICILDESKMDRAFFLREILSDRLPTVTIRVHMGGGNLKKQLKRADASGAGWAILHGAEESDEKRLVLKDLRGEKGQLLVSIDELIGTISSP